MDCAFAGFLDFWADILSQGKSLSVGWRMPDGLIALIICDCELEGGLIAGGCSGTDSS